MQVMFSRDCLPGGNCTAIRTLSGTGGSVDFPQFRGQSVRPRTVSPLKDSMKAGPIFERQTALVVGALCVGASACASGVHQNDSAGDLIHFECGVEPMRVPQLHPN